MTPTARREAAHYACERGLSQRQACALVGLARGSYAPPANGGRGGIQPADAELVRRLRALVKRHGVPARIRVDNGPELIRQVLQTWCRGQQIALHWIQPASPTQNAYIERFNGSFRREFLNAYLFTSLRQVREQCQRWQYDYNHLRPQQALNFLTPMEFRQAA